MRSSSQTIVARCGCRSRGTRVIKRCNTHKAAHRVEHTFTFYGLMYFWNSQSQKESIKTTITIEAPDKKTARAILDNYGMESVTLKGARA